MSACHCILAKSLSLCASTAVISASLGFIFSLCIVVIILPAFTILSCSCSVMVQPLAILTLSIST